MDYLSIINKFINGDFDIKNVSNYDDRYWYYNNAIKYLNNNKYHILDYQDILTIIKDHDYVKIYLDMIEKFNDNLLVLSDVHGIDHIVRASLYVLIISIYNNIDVDDFKVLMEAILYHDIGRVNDIDDDLHGYRASLMVDFLKDKYNDEDFDFIKGLMICHSLKDSEYLNVCSDLSIINTEKFYKLLCIIKDSDGLDRTRENPYVDIKFLRTDIGKMLLCFAYNFFCSYDANKQIK